MTGGMSLRVTIDRLSEWQRRVGRAVFGDRIGATLFVGACLFYGVLWQVGFFLNDTWTIANTLVGVADGHLYIDQVVYGNYLGTPGTSPGTHVVGQRVYGRNYGQVFFALPFLWILQGLTAISDPRILLAGLWSLGIVLFGLQIGTLLGRYREFVVGGCLLALGLFIGNVWLARPLASRWLSHLSLQFSTILAAGLLVVVLYRLIGLVADRRTATTLAAAAAVSTPVAFWAALPKRHSLSALLVLLTVYSFARSRTADDAQSGLRFRALAYAWVGLLAWVHAAEGLVAFIALASVDLATARGNRLRELGTIGLVFGISLLPFVVTNFVVTGDPMLPPRSWPNFDGSETVVLEGELLNQPQQGGGPTTPDPGATAGRVGPLGLVTVALTSFFDGVGFLWNYVSRGMAILTTNPEQLSQIFIRGGWSPYQTLDKQAINLTFLESAPVLGAVLALPAFSRKFPRRVPQTWSSSRQIDLLVFTLSAMFLLFYLPRLPVHASITVRYLHPLIPLAVYTAARLPPIQAVCRERLRTMSWSYAAGVLIGGQLLIVSLAFLPSSYGAAIQLQALVNLSFGGLLAIWSLSSAFRGDDPRLRTAGAVLLGITLAIGTLTVMFLVTNHLAYGEPVIGIGRVIRHIIPP